MDASTTIEDQALDKTSTESLKQWVQEQFELEAVASDVLRLEERSNDQKEIRQAFDNLHHRLHHITSILRKEVVERLAHYRLEIINSKSTVAQLAPIKQQILVEMVGNPEMVVGLGLRLSPAKKDNCSEVILQSVDCEQRRCHCRAACCTFPFALTEKEVQAGNIRWSLDQPFVRLSGEDGYCIHLDRQKMTCSIYDNRPEICQHYSCVNDKRIWSDYKQNEVSSSLKIKAISLPIVQE